MPKLPEARGATSAALIAQLKEPPHAIGVLPAAADDALFGDDSALALYVLYELHYRSFDDVSDGWEWEPSLLRERARLEERFVSSLRSRVGCRSLPPGGVVAALRSLATD